MVPRIPSLCQRRAAGRTKGSMRQNPPAALAQDVVVAPYSPRKCMSYCGTCIRRKETYRCTLTCACGRSYMLSHGARRWKCVCCKGTYRCTLTCARGRSYMPQFGAGAWVCWVCMLGHRIRTELVSHGFWPEQPLSAETLVSDVSIWVWCRSCLRRADSLCCALLFRLWEE